MARSAMATSRSVHAAVDMDTLAPGTVEGVAPGEITGLPLAMVLLLRHNTKRFGHTTP